MRVLRDSTSWETSLMILALSLGESVVNHFARRCCGGILLTFRLKRRGGRRGTHHFTLPGQEDEVAARGSVRHPSVAKQRCRGSLDGHPILKVNACGRGIQLVQEKAVSECQTFAGEKPMPHQCFFLCEAIDRL